MECDAILGTVESLGFAIATARYGSGFRIYAQEIANCRVLTWDAPTLYDAALKMAESFGFDLET